MTRMFALAAIATLSGSVVLADAHTAGEAEMIRTRDITGGPVMSLGEAYEEDSWLDEGTAYTIEDEYDQIGSIEDIVLDSSGQMIGIVAEIGGFLDLGDKHVMLPVDDVRLVPVDDTSYAFVTRLSEEALEELPGVDEGPLN